MSLLGTLRLPKQLELKNSRLSACYYALVAIALGSLFAIAVISMPHLLQLPVAEYVSITQWPTGNIENNRDLDEQLLSDIKVCESPRDYDYWDETDVHNYTNHTCLPLCAAAHNPGECIFARELARSVGPRDVLFPTHLADIRLSENASPLQTQRNYLIPYLDGLGVGFSYCYNVPEQPWWGGYDLFFKESRLKGCSRLEPAANNDEVYTVVLDANNEVKEARAPSSSLEFSLRYLLDIAGGSHLLDEQFPEQGKNALPAPRYPKGPVGRVLGLSFFVFIECSNRWSTKMRSAAEAAGLPSKAQMCTMKLRPAPMTGWREYEEYRSGVAGVVIARSFRGISFKFVSGGYFYFWHYSGVVAFLTTAIVTLGLPKQFMLIFACRALGHLSKIYRRAVHERFELRTDLATLASRLLSNSVSFLELEDMPATTLDGRGGRISKERVTEQLKEIIYYRAEEQGGDIDELEADSFVNFCYRSILKKGLRGPAPRSFKDTLKEQVLGRVDTELDEEAGLDIDSFSESCSATDRVDFASAIKLFDKERELSFLERVFTPQWVRFTFLSRQVDGKPMPSSQGRRDVFDPTRSAFPDLRSGLRRERARMRGLVSNLQEVVTLQQIRNSQLQQIAATNPQYQELAAQALSRSNTGQVLSRRLSELERSLQNGCGNSDTGLGERLGGLEKHIADLVADLEACRQSADDSAMAQQRLTQLSNSLQQESDTLAAYIGELNYKVEALTSAPRAVQRPSSKFHHSKALASSEVDADTPI